MKTAINAKQKKPRAVDGSQFKFVADRIGSIRCEGVETLFVTGDVIIVHTSHDRRTTAKINGDVVATTKNIVVINRGTKNSDETHPKGIPVS